MSIPAVDMVKEIDRLNRDLARLRTIKVRLELSGDHPETRTKLRWFRHKTEVFTDDEELELIDFTNVKMRQKEARIAELEEKLLEAMPEKGQRT